MHHCGLAVFILLDAGDGQVRWDEYLEAMIMRLGYCNREQLEQIRKKFDDVQVNISAQEKL